MIEPIILEDNASIIKITVDMWPLEQQDNIIIIKERSGSPVWNVSLFPIVQQVLAFIHEGFFRSLDSWSNLPVESRGPPPSSLTYYKEYMRKELSNRLAE
jgi:hypothetical protein